MPHVNQPYFNNGYYASCGGGNWSVVINDTGLTKPRGRNIDVISCDSLLSAWAEFRIASKKYGQDNKTEDVTGRLPIDWKKFHAWKFTADWTGPERTEFPAVGLAA